MRHKQFILLLALFMSMVTSVASAHEFEVDGIYYRITSSTDQTVAVTYLGDSYDSYSNEYTGKVTIPESVTYNSKTYSVTSIDDDAFSGCYSLTSIEIPNSVTSIGNYTFYECTGLIFVKIPDRVKSIGWGTFYGCSSLTSVTIPNSVISIRGSAFEACGDLEQIKVASGNTTYDSRDNCNAIIETVSNTLVAGCKNTVIPNGVTCIGRGAFDGCSSLQTIEIPNSVTCIGYAAFYNCSSLTSITIPNNVTSIGAEAFQGCTGLTSVIIGNSVTRIGDSAFSGCSNLTSVTIGSGVTSIGNWAFEDCTGLTDVYCFAADVPVTIYGAFDNVPTSSATLHVPAASIEAYKTTSPWSEFGTIVAIEEEELDIEPMETETEIAFDEAISEETDLSGVVVENMFITLDQGSGDGYLQEEGCLVISSTLTEEQVKALQADGLNIWEVRNGFNGIIMEVPAGAGTISVTAQTGEGRVLSMKVGDSDAQSFVQAEQGTVTVSYEVETPQYVYIYGSQTAASSAKRRAQGSQENTVRIYGVKWAAVDSSGITAPAHGSDAEARQFFTPDGKLTVAPQHGINIVRMNDGSVKRMMVK